jgi:HK97 family phage major capsid protein
MTIAALRTEYTTLLTEDADFWTKNADKPDSEITADQKTAVKDRNKRIEEIEHQLSDALELEGIRSKNQERRRTADTPVTGLPTPNTGEAKDGAAPAMSLGEQFINDPQFKQWFKEIAPQGRVAERQRIQSPPVQLKTLLTGLSSTSGGALVVNQRLATLDMGTFMRPLTIRDIVTTGTTNSDTVEYVRMGATTNAAAPVAEATATAGASGAKPESAMALAVVTETVKTIAHWIPATRRALADAGQLRTLIDSFLRYGLEEELEDQMLTGDATGENFDGILHVAGTTAQAWSTDILTTLRKARTKVTLTGRATPTAYALNPLDWETIDLLQDNEARYYFGGPSVLGNPRMWGLPVVESEGVTQGIGVCADWRLAVLWDREQAQILTTDSHSDFFTRNMIVILAELRAAFGVIRPSAFVIADLTA